MQRALIRCRTLLLAAHGSASDRHAAAPVRFHARRIRAMGKYDRVAEAYWKEPPFLRDALDAADGDDVIVMPMFLAKGYYARHVVPRELALDGALTRRGDRTIVYCEPLGAHPAVSRIVLERARQGMRPERLQRHDTTLVIAGHGTDRVPDSAGTVERAAHELRNAGFARVVTGYLDQDPRLEDVAATIDTRVCVVPFFLADGWHARVTIRERLGSFRGPRLCLTPPVGTHPAMTAVILAAARAAEAAPTLHTLTESNSGMPAWP